jgi:hypothetical protein
MYFAFAAFNANHLLYPGLIGIIVFIFQRISDPKDTVVIVMNAIYCVFISCWCAYFLEMWKRESAINAIIWGQMNIKDDEHPRP